MAADTVQIKLNVPARLKQYTKNGTDEELQTLFQDLIDYMSELGWGWTYDLDMTIEWYLNENELAELTGQDEND